MIDINLFNKALKSSWIAKYLDSENHGKWKLLFDLEIQSFGGEEVFRGNLSKEDFSKHFKISDTFISEILRIWMDIKHSLHGTAKSAKLMAKLSYTSWKQTHTL